MKRLFIVLLTAAILPILSVQASTKDSGKRVQSVLAEFTQADGANVVQIGGLGTTLLKRVIAKSVDLTNPEEAALMDLIRGIRKFTVIEYGDCSEQVRQKLVRKLERTIPTDQVLMDFKDESGESMRVYGIVSEDGRTLKDFVLHAPGSSALICLFGSLSVDGLTRLMEE
jgi:hypothetical protein